MCYVTRNYPLKNFLKIQQSSSETNKASQCFLSFSLTVAVALTSYSGTSGHYMLYVVMHSPVYSRFMADSFECQAPTFKSYTTSC